MGKSAFVFPGQGAQTVGMGRDLYDTFPVARDTFERVDQALSFPLSEMCFDGPEEVLRLTENTQPAIVAVSVAIERVLKGWGMKPDYVAGHSLGEYSAVVSAGGVSLEDAVCLVRKRGQFMQESVPLGEGAMAAIIGLNIELVESICRSAVSLGVVSPANLNAADQIVISGASAAVERASELALQQGAKRAIPLSLSAPFHCDLMAPAARRLSVELEQVPFRDLEIPLFNNVDAKRITQAAEVSDSFRRQVCAPVRWVEVVGRMVEAGVDNFVEVGPGKVLSGLIRKISPQSKRQQVCGIHEMEALASHWMGAKM